MTGTINTSPKSSNMRNLRASSSPKESMIFNRTCCHESVGSGALPLLLPLPLPLSRLLCPRLVEVSKLASADAKAPNMTLVSWACHDARGGACLASRWRVILYGTPGCRAAGAEARCAPVSSSFLLPPPALFGLERPSFSFSFSFFFSSSFSVALPPVAAIRDASTTEGRLELLRCEFEHGPRLSSRTGEARRCKGRCRHRRNGGTRVGTSRGPRR